MRRRAAAVLGFAAFVCLAILLRHLAGATASSFGAFEDEPAHLVTALMGRDWLAHPEPAHPVRYAEAYYQHYPKVAAGQWPPGLHGALAVWMLVFGVSRFALVAFPAACAGAAAWLVARLTAGELGWLPATCAGALLLALPLVQTFSGVLMTELPLAVLCTLAVLAFGRFLDTGRAREMGLFSAYAVLALYLKGNALALGLLPLGAIAIARRWQLLRVRALWVGGAVVGLLAAPWYLWTMSFSRGTWAGGSSPTLDYARAALPFYVREVVLLGGVLVLVLAGIGFCVGLAGAHERGRWAALSAWPPCWLVCHLVIPSSIEARHLVLLAPTLALAAASGAGALSTRFARGERARTAWACALLVLPLALHLSALPRKDWTGFDLPARMLVEREFADAVLLVASDAAGEGMLVAEVALLDGERPSRFVLRASKVLGSSDWLGQDYVARFEDAAGLRAFLAEVPVGPVAFDHSTRAAHWFAHHDLLLETLRSTPGWEPAGRHELVRDGVRHADALELWVQPAALGQPLHGATLDELQRQRLAF